MATFYTCPFKNDIENKEKIWMDLFDRDISYDELLNLKERSLIGIPYVARSKFSYSDDRGCTGEDDRGCTGENERYKLNFVNPIKYGTVRFDYSTTKEHPIRRYYIINDCIDSYKTFEKIEKYEEILRSKGYKISYKDCNEKYAEKSFMAISLINVVNGGEYYLLPAVLTQRRRAFIERTNGYHLRIGSGTINRALDEFIKRKKNPTQKEVVDFLIELIGRREIYISTESLVAQIYGAFRYYDEYIKRNVYSYMISNTNVVLCNANFIGNTDVRTILSCI